MSAPIQSQKPDCATHGLVLLCFGTALFWFVAGAALYTLAGLKLVLPGFLDGIGFLTYGRVVPAAMNALVYGWASLGAFGVVIWLISRFSGPVVCASTLLACAIIAWNLALLVGVLAVLAGGGTGIPGLELPAGVSVILLVELIIVAVWGLAAFRKGEPYFISQFYLVGALLAFPWLYASANVLITWRMIPGSALGPLQAWFESGVFGLWLAPVAIAALYYFLPKAADRPVYSGSLAAVGFWTLLLCAAWMGTSRYQGGPIPAWLVSAGVVAAVLLLVPAIAVSTNLHRTIGGSYSLLWQMPATRYLVTSAASYLGWSALTAFVTLPAVNSIVHFSTLSAGVGVFGLLGFVTFALVGAMYAILGSLRPVSAIRGPLAGQFWMLFTGVGLILAGSFFGGLFQGFALYDPAVTFANSVIFAAPFRWVELAGAICVLLAAFSISGVFARWMLSTDAGAPTSSPKKEAVTV